jgi:hypothetical protein
MQSPNTANDASKTDQIEEQERRKEAKEKEDVSSRSLIPNHTTLTDFNLTDKSIEIKGLSSILSSQNKIHKKIQLWTNKYQSEFALRLVDDATATDQSQNFLAVTDPKADYIRVVAEIDYFGDLKHGWDYTLRHLLEQYKEELHSLSLGKIDLNNNNNNSKPNRITIKLIPYIKCHYCDLEFNNEEEEKEHELGYHI